MRIYLSGPMTSLPDNNIPKFNAVAERLRAEGHFVINPADISHLFGTREDITSSFNEWYNPSQPFEVVKGTPRIAQSIMDADLAAVRSCDAIYLLRGWESSRGAKKELAEALAHGLTVMQEPISCNSAGK